MSLFSELKKRKVFATAAIYVPVAWLAAEIFIVLADRLGAPQWVGDVFAVLFVLGFPVALLLSWLFDITKDGVVRASPGTPLGITVLLASGLFLSVGAFISYQVFSGRLSEISVAVLPLKTDATNFEAQLYSSGITDSLRSSLQQISVFRVSAQTSSEAVVKIGLDIPEIAAKLEVQYIVEGALEMVGDRMDVSISLIDEGGEVQWSDRFEGAVEDIFDLHNDLIRAVALQLDIDESNPQLQRNIRKPAPTQDREAYRLYLQGKRGEPGSVEALRAANERDPGYADVYAALATQYAFNCWALDDRNSPLCEIAVNYANEGLELDPELGEALAATALVHSIRYDYQDAQAAIDQLLALPGWETHSASLPYAYMNLGRLQEVWKYTELLYRNDPLNHMVLATISLYEWSLKDDVDMSEYYEDILIELGDQSFNAAFPESRMHRVDVNTAVEEFREIAISWDITPDIADIWVRPIYDPSLRPDALVELKAFYERGDIRFATYWEQLISLRETDEAVNMTIAQFDEGVLNPVMFWVKGHGRKEFRSHPRFIELVEYVGLAAYWDEVGWPIFCEPRGTSHFCGLDLTIE